MDGESYAEIKKSKAASQNQAFEMSTPLPFHSFDDSDQGELKDDVKRTSRIAKNKSKHLKSLSLESGVSKSSKFATLPAFVAGDLSAWTELNLSDLVLQSLSDLGYNVPTPIQKLSIPLIMDGHDIIGKAATGSGKTLAFGLPIIDAIQGSTSSTDSVTALVLVPTRELAQQVASHLANASSYTSTRIVVITGGLSIQKQMRQLAQRADIVVATPGRFWEIMSSNNTNPSQFSHLKYLVLDEADRILQEGHFKEVQQIIEALGQPTERQTMVFSATFQKELQRQLTKGKRPMDRKISPHDKEDFDFLLQKLRFRQAPRFIDMNPDSQVATKVRQCIIETAPAEKDYYLFYLLARYPARTLIFTNSISDVHRLVLLLNLLGVAALGLHSNKQQKARSKAVERFKANELSVLVASDVAARGLDIPLVDMVIHYHLPRTADLYIHRSGRTARALNNGLSILICSPNETPTFRHMQKTLDNHHLVEFAINSDQVGALKPRVNMARQILKLEDESQKLKGRGTSWLTEAAHDLGVDLVEEAGHLKSDKLTPQIKSLRAKLIHELKKPICGQFSPKYLTKGGSDLAARLLSGDSHQQFLGEQVQRAIDTVPA